MSLVFGDAAAFDAWLSGPGATEREAWLVVARKGVSGLTTDEAGDVAIAHGWIDSHRRALSGSHFRQRYSPRRPGSAWSQVNVERVETLAAAGRLRAGGHAEMVAAKADGRWAAAYPPQATAVTPPALAAALAADPGAAAAYAALSRSARYTLFLPLLKARTPKTRATALKRILNVFG
ncbi:YdeI/OmpD-associated family protein [Dactylosporangium sp. NPDC049140]|uniref:YdeI/OmpD-associated family protein n=1 Tax=Dactylosporangium sp. NPDC049140 TaxID=3155647 RepID=UPI0033D35C12